MPDGQADTQKIMRLSPTLAAEIGLNESIVLLQLEFLTSVSTYEIEGEKWIRGSLSDLIKEHFQFMTMPTLSRVIASLVKDGLVKTGKFNKFKYDRTQWLSISLENCSKLNGFIIFQNEKCISQIDRMHDIKMRNASYQNETTIQENQEKNHEEIQEDSFSDEKEGDVPPPPQQPKPKRKSKFDSEIQHLFAYWREKLNHPQAQLGSKRRTVIMRRLTDGYTAAQLERAIDGCARFPTYNGRRYDELEMIFANEQQVEKFIRLADQPNGATSNGASQFSKGNGNGKTVAEQNKSAPGGYRTPKPVPAVGAEPELLEVSGQGMADSRDEGREAMSMPAPEDRPQSAISDPGEVRTAKVIPFDTAARFAQEPGWRRGFG